MSGKRMVPVGTDGAQQTRYGWVLLAPGIDSTKWLKPKPKGE